MYNERKDSFSIKNLIIQLLFIVLLVFVLIWLFPSKKLVEDGFADANTKFDVLTNRIYNDNLQTMKEAALYYYTTPRLPKNVNDVESMTLREMIEKKLLIKFRDANNKECDLDESYVEITKLEDEFVLKVNLKCTDNDAYILVYLGCYDYCTTAVCENKDAAPSVPILNTTPNTNPEPTPDVPDTPGNDEPEKPAPVCSYKYQKVVANSIWSDWSKWSTDEVVKTDTKEVDTKIEETTGTREVTKYKDEEYLDKTKPIIKEVYVQNGEPISVAYCSSYKTETETTGNLYEWVDNGTAYYTSHPGSTGTTRYEYVGVSTVDCDDCFNGILYIYRKYTLNLVANVTEKDVCDSWDRMSAPVYMVQPEVIGYETSVRKVPYKDIETYTISTKYYRFRTLSTTYTTLTEWSSSQNDQNLLGQGYKYVTSVCK